MLNSEKETTINDFSMLEKGIPFSFTKNEVFKILNINGNVLTVKHYRWKPDPKDVPHCIIMDDVEHFPAYQPDRIEFQSHVVNLLTKLNIDVEP